MKNYTDILLIRQFFISYELWRKKTIWTFGGLDENFWTKVPPPLSLVLFVQDLSGI